MSESLFEHLDSAPEVTAETDATAWLRAMLDVEAALARACAAAGLVPEAAAAAIAGHCRVELFDAAAIARRAVASTTPVLPMVEELTALVPADAAPYVHFGATSQDVVDTAMCLVARRASGPLLADVAAGADILAALAAQHRDTVHMGRTLLRRAAPTTFGLVCAGWLAALDDAATELRRVCQTRLAVQLGGAVGTLAGYGVAGQRVTAHLAGELGLAAAPLPWHTSRGRIAALAAALGIVVAALATVAQDVILLGHDELAEVAEGQPGGSTAMPHKRNPARSVLVVACAEQVPGLVGTVFALQPQELQRAAGRWQAEWRTVTTLLRLVGAAALHHRALVTGLVVDADRMRANVAAAGHAAVHAAGHAAVTVPTAGLLVDRALAEHRGTAR